MKSFNEDERVKKKRKKKIQNHKWKSDKTKITKGPIMTNIQHMTQYGWSCVETYEKFKARIGKLKRFLKIRRARKDNARS